MSGWIGGGGGSGGGRPPLILRLLPFPPSSKFDTQHTRNAIHISAHTRGSSPPSPQLFSIKKLDEWKSVGRVEIPFSHLPSERRHPIRGISNLDL